MVGELAERIDPLRRIRDTLDPMAERVIEAMPSEAAITTPELAVLAGLDATAVGGVLLRLVASGLVSEQPEGYARVAGAADAVLPRARPGR